jgi:hypothetical protein
MCTRNPRRPNLGAGPHGPVQLVADAEELLVQGVLRVASLQGPATQQSTISKVYLLDVKVSG